MPPTRCGIETRGDPLQQFRAGYYLYGILFLIFDVEVVFLLPFAVAFLHLPVGAVAAMLVLSCSSPRDLPGPGSRDSWNGNNKPHSRDGRRTSQ